MAWGAFWAGKRVLVTGHTGFKGGWLCHWLSALGAEPLGIALAPNGTPSFFGLTGMARWMEGATIDIRDAPALSKVVTAMVPDIIFHLAAQPLVRRSYDDPVETFSTNISGTAHILEAARGLANLQAILVITTDKVYLNREWPWPYRETDTLGGKDPYSASKSAAELVTASYRDSFFKSRGIPVMTARGGNVFGGGDWGADRLVPDLVRAMAARSPLQIRAPTAIRPWQHVLTLCHGYLSLGEQAITRSDLYDTAWNFGPSTDEMLSVQGLLGLFERFDNCPKIELVPSDGRPEAHLLNLDSSLARNQLGWLPRLTLEEGVEATVQWYNAASDGNDMHALTMAQIAGYQARLDD